MPAIATKHPRRSNAYQFSIPNNAEGLEALEEYRKIAKVFNAEQRLLKIKDPTHEQLFWKVAVFGRLGKKNPNAVKYQQRPSWRNPYQRIAREDAATLDVYGSIYTKKVTTYQTFSGSSVWFHFEKAAPSVF